MRTVVCLAGGIASGKTTLAQALAEVWPNTSVRSFGDVVRRRALADGLPATRSALQDLGRRLIAEGWPAFVSTLLADVPTSSGMLVVDGMRHLQVANELRRRLPDATVYVVYVASDDAVIRLRLAGRGESPDVLKHEVEAELFRVAETADLVLDTNIAVNLNCAEIVRLIDKQR